MQTKTSRQQSSQTEQRAVQAQLGLAGQRRSDSLGNAGVLLSLQRSHGNRYVQRLLDAAVLQRSCGSGAAGPDCGQVAQAEEHGRPTLQQKSVTLPPFIQAKLTVSQPGDAYEQEADRVAEEVMRMHDPVMNTNSVGSTPPPAVSRYPAPGEPGKLGRQAEAEGQPVEEDQFSTASILSFKEVPGASYDIGPDLESQILQTRGGGAAMSTELRGFFEPRFGANFSAVRIHTEPAAAQTAQRVSARAYTLGSDITFAPGEFRPDSQDGRRLLAHELTHVIQQGNQVRTVMRACDCTVRGGSAATTAQHSFLHGHFPNLNQADYCVTAPATTTYNCIAWSIGNTSKSIWGDVDKAGNNNTTVELSDFDAFYQTYGGLTPVVGSTPATAQIALYAVGDTPKHAALKTGTGACAFESKLGDNVRIAHEVGELEGGSYGDVNRYYV